MGNHCDSRFSSLCLSLSVAWDCSHDVILFVFSNLWLGCVCVCVRCVSISSCACMHGVQGVFAQRQLLCKYSHGLCLQVLYVPDPEYVSSVGSSPSLSPISPLSPTSSEADLEKVTVCWAPLWCTMSNTQIYCYCLWIDRRAPVSAVTL